MMKRLLTSLLLVMAFTATVAQDDVDTRIAVNDETDANTFVVIIANENYKYEHPVAFALNDGETFRLYCEKTLGIPAKNIRYAADATLNDMRMQLQWLQKVMKAYGGEARAIVYYSGHGMPDDATRQAYLLPVDGSSSMASSGLSTATLYKDLGAMPSAGTLVLLDACFSGASRDGQMLSSQSKGVVIKAKADVVSGNMVVFSAAQGIETAYPYQEKRHGLFTYYLLQQLQQNGGSMTLGDLSDQVTKYVGRTSIVENDKSQTPVLLASTKAIDWRKWVLAHKRANRFETVKRNSQITTTPTKTTTTPVITEVTPVNTTIAPSTTTKTSESGETTADLQKQVFTVGNVSFTMIRVEGGTFTMGATSEQDSDAYASEKPAHQVKLSTYYIGETEVTQALWETVMGNNPSIFKGSNLPVENVSWIDCKNFIYKLNRMTGKRFRFPTEAEWEFAARGGNKSQGFKYSGSNAST